MRGFLLFILITLSTVTLAQHCPWDCSGLVILDWPKDKNFGDYKILLVDAEHKVVKNDNVDEAPPSEFLLYADLKEELNKKIDKIPWYEHYTAFYFAEGSPVTLYNFCEYQEDLYVEVKSKNEPAQKHYFLLHKAQKFHLHDTEHWRDKTPESFDPKFKVKISF